MKKAIASAVVQGDAEAAAAAVSLNYVSGDEPGIARIKRGRSFAYRGPRGPIRDGATLARIRTLAIPPAWTGVWISTDPDGHLQATGRDARGRKQYRYHPRWRSIRDAAKYHRMIDFCAALPGLRRQVARDLACRCLCREKVVATVVALMERCQLRVGNDEYTRQNGSYGATTLRDRHARFTAGGFELSYRGKSGVERRMKVTDRRLTGIVRRCRDLPGQRLFQYVDAGGAVRPISSTDVNEYIRAATGGPFSAKDYRTWAATLAAAVLLCREPPCTAERAIKQAVNRVLGSVAARLGHTVAVCRGSYVHPAVLDGWSSGALARALAAALRRLPAAGRRSIELDTLRAVEPAVARYLARPVRRALRRAA